MYCNNNPCLLPTVTDYRICPINHYASMVEEDDEVDRALAIHYGQQYLLQVEGFEEFSMSNLEPFYRLFSEEQNYSL